MRVPVFSARDVRDAMSPAEAYEAVQEGFVAYARGEWSMPPKLYVTNYPAGDFRAMPAIGGGHALLKWVTSFPGNPARGLPTVTGLVLLSDANDGRLLAVLDASAVTALRTAAAAVLAAETLGREDASSWSVVGVGANRAAAQPAPATSSAADAPLPTRGAAPAAAPAPAADPAPATLQAASVQTTKAGLPRRVPRANLAPGMVAAQAAAPAAGPTPGDSAQPSPSAARSPEEVRSMLSSYRSGLERGRMMAAGEDADRGGDAHSSSRSDDDDATQ